MKEIFERKQFITQFHTRVHVGYEVIRHLFVSIFQESDVDIKRSNYQGSSSYNCGANMYRVVAFVHFQVKGFLLIHLLT